MGFKKTTSYDLFNAINGFATTAADQWDKMLREQAETDLRYMASEYQIEADQFMLKLDQENSYQNWQQEMDNFLQKQSEKMKSQSKNAYTARMAEQMLNSYRPGLQQAVQQKAWTSQKNDKLSTDKMTLANYENNSALDPNTKFALMREVFDSEYKGGYIDHENYKSLVMAAANKVALQYLNNVGSAALDEAILSDDKNMIDRLVREAQMNLGMEVTYLSSVSANNNELTAEQKKMILDKKNQYENSIKNNEAAKNNADKEYKKNWENYKKEKNKLEKQIGLNKKKSENEKKKLADLNGNGEINAEDLYFNQEKIRQSDERLAQINKMIEGDTASIAKLDKESFDIVENYKKNKSNLQKEGEDIKIAYDDFVEQVRLDAESYDDIELKMFVNNKDLADEVITTLNKMYDSKLADYQRKNNDEIERHYSKCNSELGLIADGKKDLQTAKTELLMGLRNVEVNYGGNKLAGSGQSQWSDKYLKKLKALEDYEEKLSSGSGSGGKSNLESLSDLIGNEASVLLQMVKDGNISMQVASEILNNETRKNALENSKKYKETVGKDKEEIEDYLSKQVGNVGGIMLLNAKEINELINQYYPGLKSIYDNFVKDMAKHSDDYAIGSKDYVNNALLQIAANADNSTNFENLENSLLDAIDSCKISKANKAMLGKMKGNQPFGYGAYMGDILQSLQENDFVTPYLGSDKYQISPAVKEDMQRIQGEQMNVIASALGLSEEEAKTYFNEPIYESKPMVKGSKLNSDVGSTMIFPTQDGKQYMLVPKKLEEGATKAGSFDVVELVKKVEKGSDGKDKVTRVPVKIKSWEEMEGRGVETAKAAANEARGSRKAVYEESNLTPEEKRWSSIDNVPKAVKSLQKEGDKKTWENKKDRKYMMEEALTNVDVLFKKVTEGKKKNRITKQDFENKTGIKYDDWAKKTDVDSRLNLIAGIK